MGFHGAQFLSSMSAKDRWETLRMLWIDTYQGSPDIITHEAGTNIAPSEVRAETRATGVACEKILVVEVCIRSPLTSP